MILRLIPLLPRIRALSLLNKRWHSLVYRSIDALHSLSLSSADLGPLLARLPSLTSMEFCPGPKVPTTLRHLELDSSAMRKELIFADPFPALTSLSICGRELRSTIAVLSRLTSSLRRLRLRLELDAAFSHSWPPFGAYLADTHFPSLTDLTIDYERIDYDRRIVQLYAHLSTFYGRHAAQLETLQLGEQIYNIKISDFDHPRLRTLSWTGGNLAILERLSVRAPQLTALHASSRELPTFLHTALHSLMIPLLPALAAELHRFPNLASLSNIEFFLSPLAGIAHLAHVEHLLERACLTLTPDVALALPRLTRLTALSLTLNDAGTTVPPVHGLKALRSLTLTSAVPSVSFVELTSLVRHFLCYCPAISDICTANLSLQPDPNAIAGFAHELDQRGAERFAFLFGSMPNNIRTYWVQVVHSGHI